MSMSGDAFQDKIGVDILAEFIEVAIHCILYNRNLYPQGVFEKRVKYNVPVQMCLHPDVCSYISCIIDSLKSLMSKGRIDKISVIILQEQTNAPIERFVLEIGDIRERWKETDPHLFQVEQSLRGFLLKLNISDALLQPAAKGTTWTVHAHTMDSTLAAVEEQLIQKDFPWTEAEEKQRIIENAKIVPVRSMTSDIFNLQLYVEEGSSVR
uniref:HORMA domain-containing protein n=1 Tax=Arion vulgaris TaxID=1028688 RepID=A0A0B6ZSV9_9EUPU